MENAAPEVDQLPRWKPGRWEQLHILRSVEASLRQGRFHRTALAQSSGDVLQSSETASSGDYLVLLGHAPSPWYIQRARWVRVT